jgi:hypothetical protein
MERNVFDYSRKQVVQQVKGGMPPWSVREGLC